MESLFNTEQLLLRLKEFHTVTNIRISVFNSNFEEIVSYPLSRAEICDTIRLNKLAEHNCRKCDLEACRIASARKEPYIYRCHAGLTEIIAPLFLGNVVVGYIFFAHFLSYSNYNNAKKEILAACKGYNIDQAHLASMCEQMPLYNQNYLIAASHLLQAVATYLCMEKILYFKYETLPLKIDRYIRSNLDSDLSVGAICNKFKVGKTQLYDIVKKLYGMGVAEVVRKMRMDYARELLQTNPDTPIYEVASKCGYTEYNYFIAAFRKTVGISPKQFALSQRNSN